MKQALLIVLAAVLLTAGALAVVHVQSTYWVIAVSRGAGYDGYVMERRGGVMRVCTVSGGPACGPWAEPRSFR